MTARFYVYALYHPTQLGTVVYIGKGQGRRVHAHAALGTQHYNPMLAAYAARKGSPLEHEIVFYATTEDEAFACERSLIRSLGRRDQGAGMLANMTDGGEGFSGFTFTAEQIEKSAAAKRGVPQTAEANAKRSSAMKGRRPSPEAIAGSALNRCGVKRSDEARARMSAAAKARWERAA